MKKLAFLFLPLVIGFAAGCSQVEQDIPEKPADEQEILIPKSFQAGVAETRTTLDGVTVLFAKDESISIWDGSGNREYKADEAGANVSFSGEVSASATEFFALSPYSASTVFAKNGNMMTAKTTLPSTQEAVSGTFASGMNISAAKSDTDDSFALENVLAVAKFTLASANLGGHQIASIELSSTYPLAGDVVVTYGETATAAAGTNTFNTVTLAHADGSALADGTYYLTLLPNAGGQITLKFTATDGYTATKTATLKSAFEAGSIKNLGTVKGLVWEAPKYYFMPATEMAEGTYLIVVKDDGKLLAAEPIDPSTGNSYGYLPKNDVTDLVDYRGFIVMEDLKDAFVFSNTSQGYSVKQAYNGLYWYQDGSFNTISVAESISQYYSVAKQTDGSFKITNKAKSKFLQYRTGYESFGSYSSAQSDGLVPILYRLVDPETVSATVTLTTLDASRITSTSAALNASYSDLFPVKPVNVGFYYGTSASSLNQAVYVNDIFSDASGEISAGITSLSENTTYYFQVTMQVWDPSTKSYKEYRGEIKSFKTSSGSSGGNAGLQWLGCYEVPAINLANTTSNSDSGEETNAKEAKAYWYSYFTTNDKQRAVTHSYVYEGKTYRNYTVLYDGNRHCPLWVAQVMHAEAYPDNNVGRNDSWKYDPGIPDTWQQTGLKNASTVGYSRGHFCASSDRQTCVDANKETFYYSNQAPQWQEKFNGSGGAWYNLEQNIPEPTGRDTLYAVQGVLFEGDIQTLPSNDNKEVSIPSHFYKLLMKCSFNTDGEMTAANGVAYLFTNEEHAGGYSSFATTIRSIEERTGINFFANIPAEFQEPAELMSDQLW